MPTLYVLSGPQVGKTFALRPGDTVGRAPDRIVTLKHASISRRHAHFEQAEGVWYVVDDGSQNGISFEGRRTERTALHDAAEFRLGEVLLRFRLEAPVETAPAEGGGREPSGAGEEQPVEEEIFLEGFDREPVEATPPPPSEPAPDRGTRRRTRPSSDGSSTERRVLQYHRVEAGSGLAGGDLGQYPAWVRALVLALGLALAGAAGWFAFRGASFVKQEVSRPAVGDG